MGRYKKIFHTYEKLFQAKFNEKRKETYSWRHFGLFYGFYLNIGDAVAGELLQDEVADVAAAVCLKSGHKLIAAKSKQAGNQ